jgi:hypothetical protein
MRKWQATVRPHWTEIALAAAIVIVAAVVGAAQVKIYIRQAKIMSTQAQIAKGQLAEMEIARRPWVTADVSLEGPLAIVNNIVAIPTLVVLRNVGQTPAIQTSFQGDAYAAPGQSNIAESRRICDEADNVVRRGTTTNYSVFPGDKQTLPTHTVVEISPDRISALWSKTPGAKPAIDPLIITCVAYTEYGRSQIHHTPMGFIILRKMARIRTIDMPIPLSDLILQRFPLDTAPPD